MIGKDENNILGAEAAAKGASILEEYQVRVEEQRRELDDLTQ